MKLIEQHQIFGGLQQVWAHDAQTLQCEMKFAVYLPNNPENQPLGVIYWLSGLTCTEQNFITKSGFQRYAAEHQVIVVAPDTSPRGEQVPNNAAYDLGQGAGFYLNATEQPWAANYQMYDYVLNELPTLIEANFPTNGKRSIMGHSMGGHGALVLQQYDARSLIQQGYKVQGMRIDQGLEDEFLPTQLRTQDFIETCRAANQPADVRFHKGYDHSYYFIASFIGEHIAYHVAFLK